MYNANEALFDNLLKTGWQSWSCGNPNRLIKLPTYDYPPVKIDTSKITITLDNSAPLRPAIKGWCSWYAFGSNIDESKILKQCSWFEEKSKLKEFNHILVDDGWESNWGDWLEADFIKFPLGIKDLSRKIQDRGFKSGIWLAPFLVSPGSKLASNHPDWLITKANHFVEGLRMTPFDRFFSYKKFILDVTNSKVTDYLDRLLDFLFVECEFKFIKLDFLYGIYFIPNLSVYQADELLRSFLLKIKNKYPNVYTIGCGCPLIPAIGTIDSMRVGPDINVPILQNNVFFKRFSNRFIYKRVIQNLRSRMWTKKLWNVDPDVFLCSDSLHLSDEEITVLRDLINEAGGNIFLGDDLTKLPQDRVEKFINF